MKKVILILRKVRAEVGFNAFRLVWGVGEVLVNTVRPADANARTVLRADRRRLEERLSDPDRLLKDARFFRTTDDGPALPHFQELVDGDRPDRWRWTSARLAYLATIRWTDVPEPGTYLEFLTEKPDAYFRYHDLNRGTNDHWEYYLVPWHRTYGRLAIALLDERMRAYALPIWQRFDTWYNSERPWMTRFIIGSNVASVLAGYTLHSLLGVMLSEGSDERLRCARRYERYGKRLRKALDSSYDIGNHVAVPYEGILYGSFWLRTLVVLGLVQRALGLGHCVLDGPECATVAEYVWKSRTPDGDYQTSGDSKPLRKGVVPEDNVFPILAAANDDAFATLLADSMAEPYFLREKLTPSDPVHDRV